MGGGRCFYHNCKISSYNCPGMHFFRFPLKDATRCGLWIKYSRQYNFYSLPVAKQKNIVICGRHFRDECFMNFKKDRLVPTAVPTIHRLAKDKALDYEVDVNHGVLVTLLDAVQSHLIAPTGFECPLGFGFDAEVNKQLRNVENERMLTQADGSLTEFLTTNSNLVSTNAVETEITIEIPADRGALKRSANCLWSEEITSDEGNESVKRLRGNSDTEDDSSYIAGDTIVLTETSEANNQPTIINHQIMDSQGRLWLQSETFSLEDGNDYQFVEIQPQSEQNKNDEIQEIALKIQEEIVEGDQISLTEDLHSSHELEASSIEIDGLRARLKEETEKAKKLQSKLSASRMELSRSDQHVSSLKVEITELRTANEELEAKCKQTEILKLQLEDEKVERTKIENNLWSISQEYTSTKNHVVILKELLVKAKGDNDDLNKDIQNSQIITEKQIKLKQEYDQKLQCQKKKHSHIEEQLLLQIVTLEESLELARQQLSEAKSNVNAVKAECAFLKSERLNSVQKVLEVEGHLQKLQEMYDYKDDEHTQLENSYESLCKSNEKLKADYTILESNQNQVSTVTTSNTTTSSAAPNQQQLPAAVPALSVLTKAQLFNGIKRYVSSSMCSLLRMEMYGSSEREWKPDERQVAVDLLRLGEFVYKYLTDEWRFRLPALRDVRNWLSQSVAIDDEEDL